MARKISLLLLPAVFLTQELANAALVAQNCFGEDEFLLFDDRRNANSANNVCRENGGLLARISSAEEHAEVVSLLNGVSVSDFWIGIYDAEGRGGNANRFTFVDGVNTPEGLEFIHKDGEFPWSPGQPNDDPECSGFFFRDCESVQFCVEWFTQNNRFNDAECSENRAFLCRRPCIAETEAPTEALATDAPTRSPTTTLEGNIAPGEDAVANSYNETNETGLIVLGAGIVALLGLIGMVAMSRFNKKKMEEIEDELIELKQKEQHDIGEATDNVPEPMHQDYNQPTYETNNPRFNGGTGGRPFPKGATIPHSKPPPGMLSPRPGMRL